MQQPPPKEPKRKWYQRLFAWCRHHPIATAAILGVFLGLSVLATMISAQTPTGTPTVQATQVQATDTPTIANGLCNPSCSTDTSPVPTQVATPLEPTQAPIPTPTTIVSDVKQNIANAIQADSDTVTYCFIIDKPPTITVAGQAVDVSMDDSSAVNIDVERAKTCIFDLERDAWATNSSFTQVTAHVQVLLQDQYGKQSVGDLARATLIRETEKKFVWSNLDADSAWNDYDSTWVLPGA